MLNMDLYNLNQSVTLPTGFATVPIKNVGGNVGTAERRPRQSTTCWTEVKALVEHMFSFADAIFDKFKKKVSQNLSYGIMPRWYQVDHAMFKGNKGIGSVFSKKKQLLEFIYSRSTKYCPSRSILYGLEKKEVAVVLNV